MPDSLTVPLLAAAVFTFGGYGIIKAERHADLIRDVLGAAFMIVAVLVVLMALAQIGARGVGALMQPAAFRTFS
ncbi:hypothetical protein R1A27_04905 [Methylobacterium sp. NMS12]|uniref:hypothetical protein n=1 Tax=Methylobacterium sp. NMS12 TaxID=3079766 RepID=UPI003F880DA8